MNTASLGSRLVALIIDWFVLQLLGWIIGRLLGEDILGIGIGFILGIIYNTYFWTTSGQTPGKRALGIRVVKKSGGNVDVLSAVIRYIGYYINTFLLLLGWLWAVVDSDHQGLHDKLAGTVVVKA